MAEEQQEDQQGQDGAGEAQEPDYKALYEQAKAENERVKAESRKWEKRSKANLDAARQAESTAKKSVEDEVAGLKAQLKRMEDERAHAELVASVAKAKGVPADLLRGGDEDELNDFADRLAEFAKASAPGVPADKGGAPAGGQRMTAEQVRKIKSPIERVNAYALMHHGQ